MRTRCRPGDAHRIPTLEEIRAKLAQERLAEYERLTVEQRQWILDCINSGFTIGQAREWVGVTLDQVCEVINHNIVNYSHLRSEAING